MEEIILLYEQEHKRIQYGLEKLCEILEECGYRVKTMKFKGNYEGYRILPGRTLFAGTRESGFLMWLKKQELFLYYGPEMGKEGFYLQSCPAGLTVIEGTDETGCLYGCLELADRIKKKGGFLDHLAAFDSPRYELRGPCIGLQKTKIEPPRLTYEYPITEGRFPWFYNKNLWKQQLDAMVSYRCNVLYLWSGHPFASLVKVAEYPEALEVTEEELQKNQEIFGWLTEECDKRGIWVVLKFYNIHIPYEFAIAHDLEQKQSSIHPLAADYTRKSIIEFVKSYPNIGLMVCLGEAIRGTQNKTDWFVDTIIPAIKEGMVQAGLKEEPPVILRGHDCDPVAAIEGARKHYSHLYTMWKYNGESLTTYYPTGEAQVMHKKLRSLCGHHILNVHILANLEPFRYMAPSFIQKCVQTGENRLGGNGLHLYPLFYWDWPYSPDKVDGPEQNHLLQLNRDWTWYEAWFRYAWNPYRDEKDETLYWTKRFSEVYSCSYEIAEKLLEAWEAVGECAPKILGRVGITEGNRQTYSLGMMLSQMTHADQYRPNRMMWSDLARRGEQPDEFVRKELAGQPHLGETPLDMVEEVEREIGQADGAMKEAVSGQPVSEELSRVCSDIRACCELSLSYCHKVKAALHILTYKYSMDETCLGDIKLLRSACEENQIALECFRRLTELTKRTYLYANSMQTPQRKIPFPDGGEYDHWEKCLPVYEKEQDNLVLHVKEIEQGIYPDFLQKNKKEDVSLSTQYGDGMLEGASKKLPEVEFKLLSNDLEPYDLHPGEAIFQKGSNKIISLIPELTGLTGLRMDHEHAFDAGQKIIIHLLQDSQLLIGYMGAKDIQWLQVPDLETDTHADDQGGLAVIYENALTAEGCPPIHIHGYHFKKGKHEIYLGTGGFVIAGVIPESTQLTAKKGSVSGFDPRNLDWLYEN